MLRLDQYADGWIKWIEEFTNSVVPGTDVPMRTRSLCRESAYALADRHTSKLPDAVIWERVIRNTCPALFGEVVFMNA